MWDRGLDEAVKADARRYELPSRKVRRLLQDKLQAGQISLDGQCHRLVEFLSELGRLISTWSRGLVVVMDDHHDATAGRLVITRRSLPGKVATHSFLAWRITRVRILSAPVCR